jgi:predicted transcriptional regulator
LAYTTVATLIRILTEKNFVEQTNEDRPFRYRPLRSFDDVSGRLLGDLLKRVFRGSREHLLVRLTENRKLTAKEKTILERILREQQQ